MGEGGVLNRFRIFFLQGIQLVEIGFPQFELAAAVLDFRYQRRYRRPEVDAMTVGAVLIGAVDNKDGIVIDDHPRF